MSEQLKILKVVASRLEQANVPYMLTGSMALIRYASPRMTRDMDFVLELRKNAVSRLYEIFKNDFLFDPEMAEDAVKHQGMFNIFHNASLLKIDFVIRKNQPYRALEFRRRQRIDFGGWSAWVVTLEDLILSKLDWAKESFSEFQTRDVKALLTSAHKIDFEYLDTWIKELGLKDVYEKARNE